MMVTTPAAAYSATGNPLSAGANQASTPPNKPSTGADRTGWFGAMTKKNAI